MARNKHPEETVNLILDVALALFFEKGYDNTSIQDIIDGLGGLTKGAVYHHFKSKEDILSAALDRDNQALFDELRRIRDDGRMTGAEKLQALFAASITGPQMDMWAKAAPDVDPVKNARLLGLQYQAVLQETVPDFVLPIVEQGVRDGSIQTDHPREFSEVIVLLANLWVSPMFRSATAEELRARVDYYLDIVKALGGLLFGLFGIEPVVFVSGAAFAVSAVLIVTVVRIPRDAIERSGVGVVRTVANDIVESFAFLRHERTVILKVIFLVAGINVTLTAFILIGAPVVITQILGLPNQYMGFAEGALALGGLAGGVSVGVFAERLRLSRAPLFLLVAALGLLPIAVVLGVPMDAMLAYGIVVAGLFVSMACATMFSIQAISFVQLETPGYLVGKVIALTMSLANCAQPVGPLIYGGLFDALRGNLVPVALGTAAVAFVIGLVTFRVLKKGLAELQAAVPGAADAR